MNSPTFWISAAFWLLLVAAFVALIWISAKMLLGFIYA